MDFSNMEVTIDHIADAGAKIKAYATVTFDGMFKVHGVRLAESKQGLNIFMPQKAFNKKIRLALKETQKKDGLYAKELLERRFKNRKIEIDESTMVRIRKQMSKSRCQKRKTTSLKRSNFRKLQMHYRKTTTNQHGLPCLRILMYVPRRDLSRCLTVLSVRQVYICHTVVNISSQRLSPW